MKQLINLSNGNLKASLPNKHTIKLTRKGTKMSHAVEFGVKIICIAILGYGWCESLHNETLEAYGDMQLSMVCGFISYLHYQKCDFTFWDTGI